MKNTLFRDLVHEFQKVKSEDETYEFLEAILTPQEVVELSKRIAIIKLLKKGVSQHEIAKKLGVGVATVTRGSKELQKGHFQYV